MRHRAPASGLTVPERPPAAPVAGRSTTPRRPSDGSRDARPAPLSPPRPAHAPVAGADDRRPRPRGLLDRRSGGPRRAPGRGDRVLHRRRPRGARRLGRAAGAGPARGGAALVRVSAIRIRSGRGWSGCARNAGLRTSPRPRRPSRRRASGGRAGGRRAQDPPRPRHHHRLQPRELLTAGRRGPARGAARARLRRRPGARPSGRRGARPDGRSAVRGT